MSEGITGNSGFLDLTHGIPSHDTFGRVFSWLDPGAFENSFLGWIQEVNFFDVEHTHAKTTNKNHGRIEVRECWAIMDPDFTHNLRGFENWKGLRSLKSLAHAKHPLGPARRIDISSPA